MKPSLKRKTAAFFIWMDKIRLPGFEGIGLYTALRFFLRGLADPNFTVRGMAMAYRFFFALFPALILVFTIVPHLPVKDLKPRIIDFISSVVPEDSVGFVNEMVDQFFHTPGFGVISINIFLLLFSSISGIKVMMAAFQRKDDFFERRKFLRKNIVAAVIFLALLFVFVAMIIGLIIIDFAISHLQSSGLISGTAVPVILKLLNWIVFFGGMQVGISALYYLGPKMKQRWAFITPGSVLATILSMLAILAFRLFLDGFGNYNKIYGSLGAVMVLMVWFYWLSIVLLIGFELNRAISRAKSVNGVKKIG